MTLIGSPYLENDEGRQTPKFSRLPEGPVKNPKLRLALRLSVADKEKFGVISPQLSFKTCRGFFMRKFSIAGGLSVRPRHYVSSRTRTVHYPSAGFFADGWRMD